MRIKSLSTLHQLAPISEKSHLRKQFTKLNLCAHLDTLCDCKSKLIDNFFFLAGNSHSQLATQTITTKFVEQTHDNTRTQGKQ